MPINKPLTFDEAHDWLDQVADNLPEALFNGLNGGIVLLPEVMPSPHGGGLYTLGSYHNEPFGLGRYITLYYGSFVRAHGREDVASQKAALEKLLRHELTHHIESLAGVRDLEVKDEDFINQYFEGQAPKK